MEGTSEGPSRPGPCWRLRPEGRPQTLGEGAGGGAGEKCAVVGVEVGWEVGREISVRAMGCMWGPGLRCWDGSSVLFAARGRDAKPASMAPPRSSSPVVGRSWASASGKCDMPRGGWRVRRLLTAGCAGRLMVVLRLRRPSHSTCSFSPMGSIMSSRFSSWIRFASSTSSFCLEFESRRMMAAVPRIASALGSVSDSCCSATSRTWSRSPLKIAASGTSLADLDSCRRMTPQQMTRKPRTILMIEVTLPGNPWKRIAEVTMVALVKNT